MRNFRVLTGLVFPTDRRAIARILAGEDVPYGQRKERRVEVGEIVTEAELPPQTVNYGLAKGYLEEIAPGDGTGVTSPQPHPTTALPLPDGEGTGGTDGD